MRKSSPVLPVTVMDQLRIWEMDLNRYTIKKSRLITGFTKQEEYDSLRNYAMRTHGLLVCSDKNWWMTVKEESYASIVSYTSRLKEVRKERSQQRKNGPGISSI
jgi:transcription initiation factor TFIIH subunit 4